jgi:hypothetical protein
MKKLPSRGLLLAAAVMLVAVVRPVLGAAGTLDEPGVALPSGYPAEARDQIMKALKRKDCTFLGGSWINAHTSLRYQGKTQALNQMLGDLAKVPGAGVSVSLKKFADEDFDWRISHLAFDNNFHFELNLKSSRLDLEELYIPPAKGPAVKQ